MEKVSVIIPSHGMLRGIETTIEKLNNYQHADVISEILICHNGPVPSVLDLNSNYGSKTRLLHTDDVGLGAGLKLGLENAVSDFVLMTATDLPFEFTDFDQWNSLPNPKPDIVIGSKGHPSSKIGSHGPIRLIMSTCYRLLRWLAFPFSYPKDPQGTLFLRLSTAKQVNIKDLSNSFFCTTELIALMILKGATWFEVPVVLQPRDGKSSVRIFRDSWDMLKRTIILSLKIRSKNV